MQRNAHSPQVFGKPRGEDSANKLRTHGLETSHQDGGRRRSFAPRPLEGAPQTSNDAPTEADIVNLLVNKLEHEKLGRPEEQIQQQIPMRPNPGAGDNIGGMSGIPPRPQYPGGFQGVPPKPMMPQGQGGGQGFPPQGLPNPQGNMYPPMPNGAMIPPSAGQDLAMGGIPPRPVDYQHQQPLQRPPMPSQYPAPHNNQMMRPPMDMGPGGTVRPQGIPPRPMGPINEVPLRPTMDMSGQPPFQGHATNPQRGMMNGAQQGAPIPQRPSDLTGVAPGRPVMPPPRPTMDTMSLGAQGQAQHMPPRPSDLAGVAPARPMGLPLPSPPTANVPIENLSAEQFQVQLLIQQQQQRNKELHEKLMQQQQEQQQLQQQQEHQQRELEKQRREQEELERKRVQQQMQLEEQRLLQIQQQEELQRQQELRQLEELHAQHHQTPVDDDLRQSPLHQQHNSYQQQEHVAFSAAAGAAVHGAHIQQQPQSHQEHEAPVRVPPPPIQYPTSNAAAATEEQHHAHSHMQTHYNQNTPPGQDITVVEDNDVFGGGMLSSEEDEDGSEDETAGGFDDDISVQNQNGDQIGIEDEESAEVNARSFLIDADDESANGYDHEVGVESPTRQDAIDAREMVSRGYVMAGDSYERNDYDKDNRWSVGRFMQRKIRSTIFGEDSRVIPLSNSVSSDQIPSRPNEEAFSSPPRPSTLLPQEYSWDTFTDRQLSHANVDAEASREDPIDDNRPLKAPLHEAADLIPGPDWPSLSACIKKQFLIQPLPGRNFLTAESRQVAMHGTVIRTKGKGITGKFFPTYVLMVGNTRRTSMLVAARKMTGKRARTPYYLLSTDHNNFNKDSDSYIGKLRSNWISTEYVCYGDGKNPKKDFAPEQNREEFVAVKFTKPGNAPRRMEVANPLVFQNGRREVCRPRSKRDGLMTRIGESPMKSQCMHFVSKLPSWDSKRQTFTINFFGRVKHASSKNFQLIDADAPNDAWPIVQFGRWDTNKFNLDATYPFSILQAFVTALTTFDARTMESFKMTY